MSGDERPPPSRTVVFRASPLQEMKNAPPPIAAAAVPTAAGRDASLAALRDDIPAAAQVVNVRNHMMQAASPLLSLLASVRSGRAEVELPRLHGMVSEAVATFKDQVRPYYSEEIVRRATYALCATADDIVLNLPGHEHDIAEWAQRSIVVRSFGENVGGDRFWLLLDQMTTQPSSDLDVFELYHACMACGFEGRYRVIAGGRADHLAKMQRTYQALVHPRELSSSELSPHWRGQLTEVQRMAFWTPLVLAGVAAALVMLLVYVGFRLALYQAVQPATAALNSIDVMPPLRMDQPASVMLTPPASSQLERVQKFLAPEIRDRLVEVVEDAASIRVRSTAPLLFDSARAELRSEHYDLFGRIALALSREPGPVTVQGYTDSARIASTLYPDNISLSQARADKVAEILKRGISDPSRVSAQGFGEAHPLATNDSAEGRARNRRVEVVIQRSSL